MIPDTVRETPSEFVATLASLWDEEDTAIERREKGAVAWTALPADFDKRRVEAAARSYLAKVEPAVSGEYGSDQTYHAACILYVRFAMDVDDAFPLLSEWNERCSPPWDHDDLYRKLLEVAKCENGVRGEYLRRFVREGKSQKKKAVEVDAVPTPLDANAQTATTATSRVPEVFRNYYEDEDNTGDRPVKKLVGYSMEYLGEQLQKVTPGWPRRIGKLLFAIQDGRPLWLTGVSDLFAWIGRQVLVANGGSGTSNPVHWLMKGADKVNPLQFFSYLTQTAEEVEAVALYPHEPALPGQCYIHPPIEGGDGEALQNLLGRFLPATEEDAQLIKAFFLTLIWGGRHGSRPIFLFTGDEQDGGGRGSGKSKLVQIASYLIGGSINLSQNENLGDVQRRLLSPVALEKRVVLLDNIKSLRFSWAELEAMITDMYISGRQMNVGEGQRPNTFIWTMTFNGANFGKDISQRVVTIQLKKPRYNGKWESSVLDFVERNRFAIIGDIVAELRKDVQVFDSEGKFRWGAWEQEVLARVENPKACAALLTERARNADDDEETMEEVKAAFKRLVKDMEGRDSDLCWVLIPNFMAADLVNDATGEKRPNNRAIAYLHGLGIKEISRGRTNRMRGILWKGATVDKTLYPHPKPISETNRDNVYKQSDVSGKARASGDASDLFEG